jgi:ABC-2 type transport system permease protein
VTHQLRFLRNNARAILAVADMTFRSNVMDPFIIFTLLIQPIIIAVLALGMLQPKGADVAIYIVVGSGMTGLWSGLLFISGNSINAERWQGTLETLVGVPTPLSVIVLGKNLANVLQSLSSMIVSYLLVGLLYGYDLSVAQPLLFAVSLLFTVLAFISFALIISPVFLMNPAIQQFQNALEFPVYLLCGFLFPIAMLPGWTVPISVILPPYWAARALHLTSSGGGTLQQIALSWVLLFIFSFLYLAASRWLFQRMLDKARRDATLDME